MKISDEIITSRQNRIVVEAIKLSEKKARDAAGLFRFDGLKLFDEALDKGVEIVRVLLSASKSDALIDKINAKKQLPDGVPVTFLSDYIFAKVSE